ncbi:MAG: AmmeMemoRadiSam system protein B, partial [Parcubacteria group bacterium CG10_big_fil_rev_8_21_14_0_10_36_14]
MKGYKLKLNILTILGLCFAGLIIFCAIYFLFLSWEKTRSNLHLSNPIELDFFETAFKFNKKELKLEDKNIVAGIIPHHLLAADLIAEFFYNLRDGDYDIVILIGPNHFNTGDSEIITSSYNWQTPYGILECDKKDLKKLLETDDIHIEEGVFENEHSINSEVSFIKKTFPKAKFLPIILKSSIDSTEAENLAEKLFELSKNKKVLVLASVDFSHYKDSPTAQKNDKESIGAIDDYDFDKVYNLDIDSPASIYTLLKFSRLSGSEFELLNNSNSAILADKLYIESTTSYVTGYFTKSNSAPKAIKMLFFGDMMLDRGVDEKIKQYGLDYIFGQLDKESFYKGYDLISANLEGAVTNNGEHYAPEKEFDFAFKPEIIADLKKYNFNFFNLANNHFGDQGAQGISETLKNLDDIGFNYAGCGNGIISDCSSKILILENKKIGMVGLTAFWGEFDLEKAKQKISEIKNKTDIVILNVHWGEELDTQFTSYQQKIAYALIDYGADLIIGHHPHVVQGIETYKNKLIF